MLKKQQKPPGFLHSNKVSPQRSYIFLLRKLLLLRVNFTNLPLGLLKIFWKYFFQWRKTLILWGYTSPVIEILWIKSDDEIHRAITKILVKMNVWLWWDILLDDFTNGLFRLFSNTSFRKVFSNGNIAKKPKITASRGNYLEGQHSS